MFCSPLSCHGYKHSPRPVCARRNRFFNFIGKASDCVNFKGYSWNSNQISSKLKLMVLTLKLSWIQRKQNIYLVSHTKNPRSHYQLLKEQKRASLVAQGSRVCLPMQETGIQSLIWEDLACCGAMEPMRHNCWASALEPESCSHWSLCAYRPFSPTAKVTATKNPFTATRE